MKPPEILAERCAEIDYTFRPDTYWDDSDIIAALLRNVKGTNRRKMIREYSASGHLEELRDELLRDTLSEDQRIQIGLIHPSFMGGEYLPDYAPHEVEIARVELKSTTSDVISIRARWADGRLSYRIVDEYETDFIVPAPTAGPLSMEELITAIDRATNDDWGLGLSHIAFNYQNATGGKADPDEADSWRGFTEVSSTFYSGLREHYIRIIEVWISGERRRAQET